MTENESQFGHCSNFTTVELKSINLAWSTSGIITLVVSSFITILLIIGKAYQSVLQRLVLYLNVTTVLSALFLIASIEHQFQYQDQKEVCTGIAFLFNWLVILRVVVSVGIMVHMLFLVYHVARGNALPQFLQSKRRRVFLEMSFDVMSTLLTLLYSSAPFYTHNYGLAGTWCWISSQDDNCHTLLSGFLNQIFSGYLIFVSNGVIGTVITILVAVTYARLSSLLPDESRSLMKKTLFVMLFFFLYSLIQLFGFSNRILATHISRRQHFIIWFVVALAHPFSLILFPVSFLFSFYPISKLCLPCYRLFHSNCLRGNNTNVRIKQTSHDALTNRKSTRVTLPSNTFFNVPYTNDFTVITEGVPTVARKDIAAPHISQLPSNTYFDVSYTNGFTDISGEEQPLVAK